jgi:hypothetical protein
MVSLKKFFLKKGLSLVEVLVASSIIIVFFMALVGIYNIYLKISKTNIYSIKAGYLAEEGIEAIKSLRDISWNNNIAPLSVNTDLFLDFSGGRWVSTSTNTYIDGMFERKINISTVNRDPSTGDILTSGGSLDAGTRLVTVTVSWPYKNATSTRVVATYITNIFKD